MNKLEKYLADVISEQKQDLLDDPINEAYFKGVEHGQNIVLLLDLPVKFDIWKQEHSKIAYLRNGNYLFNTQKFTAAELYQYWIDNIYKPE